MSLDAEVFAKYCEDNLIFEKRIEYKYNSLSACIIDCVYSLRANYYLVTVPVVKRYANEYMDNNDPNAEGDTCSDLISHIDDRGMGQFIETVFQNHQKTGGVEKGKVCYNLACVLRDMHIETIEEFREYKDRQGLWERIHSVEGIGDAATNYLFILTGCQDKCKCDKHIQDFIKEACGTGARSDEECQRLFAETVDIMQKEHPELTVAMLDGIIWINSVSKD